MSDQRYSFVTLGVQGKKNSLPFNDVSHLESVSATETNVILKVGSELYDSGVKFKTVGGVAELIVNQLNEVQPGSINKFVALGMGAKKIGVQFNDVSYLETIDATETKLVLSINSELYKNGRKHKVIGGTPETITTQLNAALI